MKLLYLATTQIPGRESAQAMQIMRMSRAFNSFLGVDFLLLSPCYNSEGKKIIDFQWRTIKVSLFWRRFLRQIIFLFKSWPVVWRWHPDYIYTRDIALAWFFSLGKKVVAYEMHKPMETRIGNFLFRRALGRIKIVAISQGLKNFIKEEYKIEDDKILVAHDGVFLEEFKKIKESKEVLKKKYFGLKRNNFVAFYQGSFQEGKGTELIFKVAQNLPEISFIFLGREKNKLDNFQAKNIHILGRKAPEEIPSYLMGADILILPNTKKLSYWRYTSPLKMFEYMATGRPIIASNLGSITEILNENNAILFDSEKENDLREKIIWARENYPEAKKRATQALKDVKKYTWTKRAEGILDFLKK